MSKYGDVGEMFKLYLLLCLLQVHLINANNFEEDYRKTIFKTKSRESMMAFFQKDDGMCDQLLKVKHLETSFEELTEHRDERQFNGIDITFTPLGDLYYMRYEFPVEVQINGLRLNSFDHYFRQYFKLFHFRLFFRLTEYKDFLEYKDEMGKPKYYTFGGERQFQDYRPGGMGYAHVDPPIVCSEAIIVGEWHSINTLRQKNDFDYWYMFDTPDNRRRIFELEGWPSWFRSNTGHFKEQMREGVKLFGCTDYDDINSWQFCEIKERTFLKDRPPRLLRASVSDCPVDFANGCSIWNFENFAEESWTKTGKAFEHQPSFNDAKYFRERKSLTRHQGAWWVSTLENHPNEDAPYRVADLKDTGTMQSSEFLVLQKMSFLVGGNTSKEGKVRVEITQGDLVKARFVVKKNMPTMQRHFFTGNEEDIIGQNVSLKLIDEDIEGYLMFDDLRGLQPCAKDCTQALGMQPGGRLWIEDSWITSNYDDLLSVPKEARLTSRTHLGGPIFNVFPDKINDQIERPWIDIRLPTVVLLAGWATQGNPLTPCHVREYVVRYSKVKEQWRYISYSFEFTRFHKKKKVYAHTNSRKTEHTRLNPRLYANQVRFEMLKSGGKSYCMRVELYKCDQKMNSDSERAGDRSKLTEENRMDYQLRVINVKPGSKLTLKCIREDEIALEVAQRFKWQEIVLASKITRAEVNNTISLYLKAGFARQTFQCFAYFTPGNAVSVWREFLLLEHLSDHVTAFVTTDHSIRHRGGPLAHTTPAVQYTSSAYYGFFSVNFANLVHPVIYDLSKLRYCPLTYLPHGPMQGYRDCSLKKRTVIQCLTQAIQAGERIFYYDSELQLFYSGSAINEWFVNDKSLPFTPKCTPFEPGSKFFSRVGDKLKSRKRHVFVLNDDTNIRSITINVEADGKKVFSKKFTSEWYKTDREYDTKDKRRRGDFYDSEKYRRFLLRERHQTRLEHTSCYKYKRIDDVTHCSFHFGPYAGYPVGTGHLATFTYINRRLYMGKFPRYRIYGRTESTNNVVSHFEEHVEVRHVNPPKLLLPRVIGVCEGQRREVSSEVKLPKEFHLVSLLRYEWHWYKEENFTTAEQSHVVPREVGDELFYQENSVLVFLQTRVSHTRRYSLTLSSFMGAVRAFTNIMVYKEYPRITWVTPSLHTAILRESDILEIRTNTDNHIRDIQWYLNNTLINDVSGNFKFIDYKKSPHQKKRLLLSDFSTRNASGTYRVVLHGKHCSFTQHIHVDVHVPPRIMISDENGRKENPMEVKKGANLHLKAIISGGYPQVRPEETRWTKGGAKLTLGGNSRYQGDTIKVKHRNQYVLESTFVLKSPKTSDSGEYGVMVKYGKTTVFATQKISIGLSSDTTKNYNEKGKDLSDAVDNRTLSMIYYVFASLACFTLLLS